MRTAFMDELYNQAMSNHDIFLLVGDVGYGVVTRFMSELSTQFVNVGIAEQNMAGVAAGLAMSGKTVFMYSIGNFPTMRCLEQIRNSICYHKANVKIVSVGGGLVYGQLGPTHHATEDIAIMRTLPNLVVMAPGDPVEARMAVRALIDTKGPAYIRLNKSGDPDVHPKSIDFLIGKSCVIQGGTDITLISTGGVLSNVVKAAALIEEEAGLKARVISMHTIKPIDRLAVIEAGISTGAIYTIEEHSNIGGLGSAVAEIIAEEQSISCRFSRIALPDLFSCVVGDQSYLRQHYGLSVESIARRVLDDFAHNVEYHA